ncbi:MAG: hypothetical protein IPJ75_16655 [Ignavibacteriales bacterium]|nr:hypothetical protein [Ignavibacteriales bacterium]
MRKLLLLSLLSIVFSAGCSKDEENPVGPTPDPSQYAASWKDSVKSPSGFEYAVVTYTGSGTNATLAGPGSLKFSVSGSSTMTIERNFNPIGLVRNDSLFLVFSSESNNEWQFKGKLNSTTNRVDGELEMKFKVTRL